MTNPVSDDTAGRDAVETLGKTEEPGPIGIFPSWRALYATVLVYAMGLIVLFYVLSEALSFGAG